jgi:hypothetical protein
MDHEQAIRERDKRVERVKLMADVGQRVSKSVLKRTKEGDPLRAKCRKLLEILLACVERDSEAVKFYNSYISTNENFCEDCGNLFKDCDC